MHVQTILENHWYPASRIFSESAIKTAFFLHNELISDLAIRHGGQELTLCALQFPYALRVLPETLDRDWDSKSFAHYRNAFPADCISSRENFEAHVRDLVSRDVKAPYLKAIQGYLWEEGYKIGDLNAPLFPDVAPALVRWNAAGIKIMIYSSGSVPAQKLLFGHTNATPSNLMPFITDWFDTVNAGPKVEFASYTKIGSNYPTIELGDWLFLSDNLKEVEAARAAGMQSLPVNRPGNPPIPSDHPLAASAILGFDGLVLERRDRWSLRRHRDETGEESRLQQSLGQDPVRQVPEW
jgi:enolase-phosphatase E1